MNVKTIISTKRSRSMDFFLKEVYTHRSSVVSVRKSPCDGGTLRQNPETHKKRQLGNAKAKLERILTRIHPQHQLQTPSTPS